jgi:hypothetical protein
VVAPWGTSVAVRAPQSPTIVGWPGLSLHARLHVGALPAVVNSGSRLGVLTVDLDGRNIGVVVRPAGPLGGPSAFWRLTRR